PVENMGNIDIDDVAVAQYLPCAGDAVADDLIDRGAHTLGEPLVVEGRWDCSSADGVLMHEGVDLFRRDARPQEFSHERQRLGGHTAHTAHGLDFLLGFYFD